MTERCSLPLEKVFPIQIGTELFRLSGASIASDAPSYFSRFFENQLQQNEDSLRTLYIDRDPETFRGIALHLQGYHIEPRDNSEFVKLFADAQFYSLPRLTSQLFASDIYIQIEDTNFRIPRDLFSTPGNTPNYFSLGFSAFFASPREVFPGLDRTGLLRPPAIEAPRLAQRSASVFTDILHLARGYPIAIRDKEHRKQILRDCRYFNLRGLEQLVVKCDVGWNPVRRRGEITIGLEDVAMRGVGVDMSHGSGSGSGSGYVTYARPFTDDERNDLIVQVASDCAVMDRQGGIEFLGEARESMQRLIKAVAKTEMEIRVVVTGDTDVVVNGQTEGQTDGQMLNGRPGAMSDEQPRKRPRLDADLDAELNANTNANLNADLDVNPEQKWYVQTGQWLLRVSETVDLVAVKLDVYTNTKERTRKKVFLA